MSVPSNLSNKLVTTNALWDILTEVTNNIYDNIPQPQTVDISGKADKYNPSFTGNMQLGINNVINGNSVYSFATGSMNYIDNNSSIAVGSCATATGSGSFSQGSGTSNNINVSSVNNNTITISTTISHIYPGNTLYHLNDGTYLITDYDSNSKTITLNRQILIKNTNNWSIRQGPIASGRSSHAEGADTQATGSASHAEGSQTSATASDAHAEGYLTKASGNYAHAEGHETQAQKNGSHAEGISTITSAVGAHAEGESTQSSGRASHAEGINTEVSGEGAHVSGYYTVANGGYSHVFGAYNVGDSVPTWQTNTSYKVGDRVYRNGTNLIYECTTDHTSASVLNSDYWKRIMTLNYVEIVGNGTATDARSNARTLDWSGNEWLAGNLTAAGGTFTLGATALTEAQLQALQALPSAIGNIHSFDVQVVQALPSSDIETHTIYFVPKTGTTNDVYDEYLYINNQWEMIGNTQIDLSGYALISAIPTKVSDLTDDSGHYTKPSGGIPASDLAETYATQTYVNNALAAKVVSVEGTTPAITAVTDTQYICGEVSTLSFTPSATGTCDVIFESGAVATVLTVPSTVKFPEWFDASALEANMTYEISITNGVYGAVMAWATT